MYSVDASALIDGWVRYYPPDVLPTLWESIEVAIADGRIRACEEVKFELERGGDELYDWARERDGFFISTTNAIQAQVDEIVNQFPSFVPERVPDGIWADPYVIALARCERRIVVTGEQTAAPTARQPKIPNVCQALDVEVIPFLQLIRREGWRF